MPVSSGEFIKAIVLAAGNSLLVQYISLLGLTPMNVIYIMDSPWKTTSTRLKKTPASMNAPDKNRPSKHTVPSLFRIFPITTNFSEALSMSLAVLSHVKVSPSVPYVNVTL